MLILAQVWIYRSKLHLVPLSYESPPSTKPKRVSYEDEEVGGSAHVDSDEGWLNIPDALKALWSDDDDTEAPKEVQESIVRRISGSERFNFAVFADGLNENLDTQKHLSFTDM